jgi:DNA invertase Pin-like site-specific DNA recombinase
MIATTATTALLYSRVSSDEQAAEGLSLPTQLATNRRYASERNWIIGHEFSDVLSGSRDDRPQYQALLVEARRLREAGRPVAIVVSRLDRLGRRLLERVQRREELKKLGVATHSVREGGEVSDLVAGILAVVAAEETERLGQRVRDTRAHNEAGGWHVPGGPAWGYRWRPATEDERQRGAPRSVLEIDEATAPYAKEMFEKVASGELSARGAAKWVADLPAEARGGRVLAPSSIRLALKAVVYIGRLDDPDPARGNWSTIPITRAATGRPWSMTRRGRRCRRGSSDTGGRPTRRRVATC